MNTTASVDYRALFAAQARAEPSDILQAGDCYLALANDKIWWEFWGPHCSIALGQSVPLDCYCYTPKGRIAR